MDPMRRGALAWAFVALTLASGFAIAQADPGHSEVLGVDLASTFVLPPLHDGDRMVLGLILHVEGDEHAHRSGPLVDVRYERSEQGTVIETQRFLAARIDLGAAMILQDARQDRRILDATGEILERSYTSHFPAHDAALRLMPGTTLGTPLRYTLVDLASSDRGALWSGPATGPIETSASTSTSGYVIYSHAHNTQPWPGDGPRRMHGDTLAVGQYELPLAVTWKQTLWITGATTDHAWYTPDFPVMVGRHRTAELDDGRMLTLDVVPLALERGSQPVFSSMKAAAVAPSPPEASINNEAAGVIELVQRIDQADHNYQLERSDRTTGEVVRREKYTATTIDDAFALGVPMNHAELADPLHVVAFDPPPAHAAPR